MAVTAIWSVKGSANTVIRYTANPVKTWNGEYEKAAGFHAVNNVMEYDADAMKTEKQFYVTGVNCSDNPAMASEQFASTKMTWGKTGGIVCFHGYQSFKEDEVTPEQAHEIGVKLAQELWGDRFQVLVSTHLNTGKYHNHFCINSVSFVDGKRYYDQKRTYNLMREKSDDLCEDYGLSVIENPGHTTLPYNEWLEKNGIMKSLYADLDAVLEYATSFREFSEEIQNRGYLLEYRGSFLRIRPDEGTKFRRLDRLGEGYSEAEIRQRCEDNYNNRPREPRYYFPLKKWNKATGIVGLYHHYVYLLRHFPYEVRPFNRVDYVAMRQDVSRMEMYSEEAKLLAAHNIKTSEDMTAFTTELSERFKALAYERAKNRNKLRRMHDSEAMLPIKESVYDLSAQMAVIRKQMKLCEDIAERSGAVEDVVNTIDRGYESKATEKVNQISKKESTER